MQARLFDFLEWSQKEYFMFYDAIRKCCKNCAYFLLNIVVFSPSNLCAKRLALKVHGLKKVFWPFLLHLAHAPELGQCLVWQKRESAFFCCIFFEGHEREKKGSSTWQKRASITRLNKFRLPNRELIRQFSGLSTLSSE